MGCQEGEALHLWAWVLGPPLSALWLLGDPIGPEPDPPALPLQSARPKTRPMASPPGNKSPQTAMPSGFSSVYYEGRYWVFPVIKTTGVDLTKSFLARPWAGVFLPHGLSAISWRDDPQTFHTQE